jgi:hypothetical protein
MEELSQIEPSDAGHSVKPANNTIAIMPDKNLTAE